MPDVLNYNDYYPFGSLVPNKFASSGNYRYGWNSQEKVDEISGEGNHNTAKFWEYDTRTARRWNADPDGLSFWSPYAVNYGMPIKYSDPDGDCPWLLVAALLLTADIAMAPTQDHADNQRKYDEASRDRSIGLVTNLAAPGVGALAEKYVLKKVVAKAAPKIAIVTEKALFKKAEQKIIGEAEKKLVQKAGQQAEKAIVEKASGFYVVHSTENVALYVGKGPLGRATYSLAAKQGEKVVSYEVVKGVGKLSIKNTAFAYEELLIQRSTDAGAKLVNKIASPGAKILKNLSEENAAKVVKAFEEILEKGGKETLKKVK